MVEVEKLGEMVGYQKQSVVSRTVIDKPKGTVTLFAFAEGEGLSEHTAPFDASKSCSTTLGSVAPTALCSSRV